MTRTLTPEQIERHMLTASECPPSTKVLLVSTVRRLLGHEEPAPQAAPAEPQDAQALRKALEQLVRLEDMRLRLHKLEESGHGADYYLYRANLSAAWYDARVALGSKT